MLVNVQLQNVGGGVVVLLVEVDEVLLVEVDEVLVVVVGGGVEVVEVVEVVVVVVPGGGVVVVQQCGGAHGIGTNGGGLPTTH